MSSKKTAECFERRLVYYYLWISMAVATVTVTVFTAIMWKIRLYSPADCIAYAKYTAVIYLIYVVIQFAGIKSLEQYIIKKTGGSHGKKHKN